MLKEFSVKLLSLPVRDSKFIALLEEQDLLPGDTKDKIAAINLTQADAAQLLLGKIKNSLSITHNGFDKLVLVMKQYKDGGMEELANQMESYVIKSNPSGNCEYTYNSCSTYFILVYLIIRISALHYKILHTVWHT